MVRKFWERTEDIKLPTTFAACFVIMARLTNNCGRAKATSSKVNCYSYARAVTTGMTITSKGIKLLAECEITFQDQKRAQEPFSF